MTQSVPASEIRRGDTVEWDDGKAWRVMDAEHSPDGATVWLDLGSPSVRHEAAADRIVIRLSTDRPLTYD